MPITLTTKPLLDAVEMIRTKVPAGSARSSSEWNLVPGEIRLRAMFSARVEDERLLAEMQARLLDRISEAKASGVTMDRGLFMEEMRALLKEQGYRRPDDVKRGSLRDLKGFRRLGLIWDMNLAQAQGYARWKADMTPEGLENEPCYELIRVMDRLEHRDWPTVWRQHGGQFFDGEGSNDDYPLSPGRMIARKTDPIWRAISRFGTPWAPFDWGSGMGLRGLPRAEADAFGLTFPGEVFTPDATPFNENLKASVKGIPEEGRRRLLDAMRGEVELAEDELRARPAPVDVPAVVLFPAPISAVMRNAASMLAKWSEEKLQKLLKLLEKTLAWPRYQAALPGAPTHEALVRAMAQFLAGTEAWQAIQAVRETASRDAFWCVADFAEIFEFLTQGGVA